MGGKVEFTRASSLMTNIFIETNRNIGELSHNAQMLYQPIKIRLFIYLLMDFYLSSTLFVCLLICSCFYLLIFPLFNVYTSVSVNISLHSHRISIAIRFRFIWAIRDRLKHCFIGMFDCLQSLTTTL